MIADPSNIFQDVAQLSHDASTNVIAEYSEIYRKCSKGENSAAFEEAKDRLSKEMNYLTDASTFIVK